MIFTRIVAALFATAACAQALYVPDTLYAWDFEDSRAIAARQLSERGLRHLNAVRDLADNNEVLVLAARDLATLGLRSEDVLSHIIVARTNPPSRTPSPGPYECKTKADCDKKITHAKYQRDEAKKSVDKWKAAVAAAGTDAKKKRNAENNLHTAQESYGSWKDDVEAWTKIKAEMKS